MGKTSSQLIENTRKAFSKKGILAKALSRFSPRQSQTTMALAVATAIDEKNNLVVEAGTGVGKTFAYLVPALLSNKKIVLTTGTKTLQDQLFKKDIPIIKSIMADNKHIALLKGRANYLCQYRLDLYRQSREQLDSSQLADFVAVRQWATTTQTGDIAEVDSLAEDSSILPHVTSTTDNCLGKDCPDFESCYLLNARKKAMEADVVVVNHHLFFADMAIKDTGFGELIPQAEVVIFDEAHQAPDIACDYFGQSFSTRQLLLLCDDVEQAFKTELNDVKQLGLAAQKLARQTREFRLSFPVSASRGHWSYLKKQNAIMQQFTQLISDLSFLNDVLKTTIGRCEQGDNCYERAFILLEKAEGLTQNDNSDVSIWYETTAKHLVIHLTPLSIAEKFNAFVEESSASWVFTSATLSVDNKLTFFTDKMGLFNAKREILSSPFDYQNNALLVVPRYLPDNYSKSRAATIANIAKRLIEAAKGNCFLLFTSYQMLNKVAELLENKVENRLLIQGREPKSRLLSLYHEESESVLLATSSFWEGVDVKGDALVCVLIDKLPFAAPDDPLLQTRSEQIKAKGLDPFSEIQIPQAIIGLKQGVGRLIRDEKDKGVMVICDDRLVNRQYGQAFLSSIPPMKRTRSLDKATEFLNSILKEK